MPDLVSVRGLEITAVIGAYDWERGVEQRLVVGLDMAAAVAAAAATDDLADAPVDYARAAGEVRQVLRDGRFALIETAACRVADRLLERFPLSWVRVEVAKPRPGDGFTAVVTVERSAAG